MTNPNKPVKYATNDGNSCRQRTTVELAADVKMKLNESTVKHNDEVREVFSWLREQKPSTAAQIHPTFTACSPASSAIQQNESTHYSQQIPDKFHVSSCQWKPTTTKIRSENLAENHVIQNPASMICWHESAGRWFWLPVSPEQCLWTISCSVEDYLVIQYWMTEVYCPIHVMGHFWHKSLQSTNCVNDNYLCQLRSVIRALSVEARKTAVHTFVSLCLDYCNSLLFGVTDSLVQRL